MADAATISVTATMLPDEIAKTISGSMTVTPADANHKWYYKLTSVTSSSTDLIGGYYSNHPNWWVLKPQRMANVMTMSLSIESQACRKPKISKKNQNFHFF